MSIIQSRHNSGGKESVSNREYNKSLSQDLRKKILEHSRGGRPEMVDRHHERGKLLVRDRIDELIDSDTCLLYTSPSPRDS